MAEVWWESVPPPVTEESVKVEKAFVRVPRAKAPGAFELPDRRQLKLSHQLRVHLFIIS
jgi:hypothetical protein